MGQKTHPYGFRLGYNKGWKSRWFAKKDYADLLHEDVALSAQFERPSPIAVGTQVRVGVLLAERSVDVEPENVVLVGIATVDNIGAMLGEQAWRSSVRR